MLTRVVEVADNTYRDGSADLNNTEASFVMDGGVSVDQRKMNAVRAYFEWMPIRSAALPNSTLFKRLTGCAADKWRWMTISVSGDLSPSGLFSI